MKLHTKYGYSGRIGRSSGVVDPAVIVHPVHQNHINDFLLDIPLPKLIFAMVISAVFWFIIVRIDSALLASVFIALLIVIGARLLFNKQFLKGLLILLYLAVLQPAIRKYATLLPYQTLEYILPVWVVLLTPKQKWVSAALPLFFYTLYISFDFLGLFRSISMEIGRAVILPSAALWLFLILSNRYGLDRKDVTALFMTYLVGLMGHVALISNSLFTNGSAIVWRTSSNFSASGDMGPVQISMLLAVGVLISVLFFDQVSSRVQRIFFILLAGFLGFLMILTFSRNGLYLEALALMVYYLLFQRPSFRVFFIIVFVMLLGWFVFQQAISVSGDVLVDRYSDISGSGRENLIKYGWDIFRNNLIMGVGTGNYHFVISKYEYYGIMSGAHNELIRAAAEHGFPGLLFWVLFAAASFWAAFYHGQGKGRAMRMAFITIFFAYSMVNGLKLMIQSFTLFLALAAWLPVVQNNDQGNIKKLPNTRNSRTNE